MSDQEEIYYQSERVTVTRSRIVIQPVTDRPAWLDWLLGHPGEQTLAMQSVSSIRVAEPSKLWPVILIAIGLPLVFVVVGIPILIAGGVWLWYRLRFGRMVQIVASADAGEVYEERTEQDGIIEAVRSALADGGERAGGDSR